MQQTRPVAKNTRTRLVLFLFVLAIVLPPLAVLLCGKPIQAVLNVLRPLNGDVEGSIQQQRGEAIVFQTDDVIGFTAKTPLQLGGDFHR